MVLSFYLGIFVCLQGEEACVAHFEQLSQEWDKENAAQIANSVQQVTVLSSKDLEVELLNTLRYQPDFPNDDKAEKVYLAFHMICGRDVLRAASRVCAHAEVRGLDMNRPCWFKRAEACGGGRANGL